MPEINKLILGKLYTNCYIIKTGENSAVVIDPAAEAERIIRYLEHNNLSVKKILLTHGHFDHIQAAPELRERYNAPIYIGKADAEMLEDCDKAAGNFLPQLKFVPFKADFFANEGDVIEQDGVTFSVMETPGHTAGSVCYFCEDCIFAGDTIFYRSAGRTDMYSGSAKAQAKSLGRLKMLEDDYEIYCGHGEETTLSFEKANNPFLY